MRTKLTTIAIAILGTILLSAPAQAADTMTCGFEADLTYANEGADFNSESGTVNCVGDVNGRTHVGVGTLQLAGTAGEAPAPMGGAGCLVGGGVGTIQMNVPYLLSIFNPDPSSTLAGNFEYHNAGPAWTALGSVSGDSGTSGLAVAGLEDASCGDSGKSASRLSGQLVVGGTRAGSASPAAGPCANHISGSESSDRLTGTSSDDMLSGFGGRDRLSAKSGSDCVFGGGGVDVLRGGRGADVLHCGSGTDVVHADRADEIAPNCEKVRSH